MLSHLVNHWNGFNSTSSVFSRLGPLISLMTITNSAPIHITIPLAVNSYFLLLSLLLLKVNIVLTIISCHFRYMPFSLIWTFHSIVSGISILRWKARVFFCASLINSTTGFSWEYVKHTFNSVQSFYQNNLPAVLNLC